jgi:hypothetical protein
VAAYSSDSDDSDDAHAKIPAAVPSKPPTKTPAALLEDEPSAFDQGVRSDLEEERAAGEEVCPDFDEDDDADIVIDGEAVVRRRD